MLINAAVIEVPLLYSMPVLALKGYLGKVIYGISIGHFIKVWLAVSLVKQSQSARWKLEFLPPLSIGDAETTYCFCSIHRLLWKYNVSSVFRGALRGTGRQFYSPMSTIFLVIFFCSFKSYLQQHFPTVS